jgi:hypothetical protein
LGHNQPDRISNLLAVFSQFRENLVGHLWLIPPNLDASPIDARAKPGMQEHYAW